MQFNLNLKIYTKIKKMKKKEKMSHLIFSRIVIRQKILNKLSKFKQGLVTFLIEKFFKKVLCTFVQLQTIFTV